MEDKAPRIKLGISIGDPNGVGIEILLKVFEDKRMFDFFTPIVFAQTKLLSHQRKHFGLKTSLTPYTLGNKGSDHQLNVVEAFSFSFVPSYGESSPEAGKVALSSLEAATNALKANQIDALVTLPINKKNIQSDDFAFPGHTDYLAKELEGNALMFMVSDKLRVGLLTDHIPVSKVASAISSEVVEKKVASMMVALQKDFLIQKPKIAVLGINPHTGDNGVIGEEDDTILRPVIDKLYSEGQLVFGPYAADSFFGTTQPEQFDAILASYHDQGLIPFKTLTFGEGVNFTAGLKKVRTSPDHGTAYDIAGKGQAQTHSFKQALFTARAIYLNRKE